MQRKSKTLWIAYAGMIAALYVVLTHVANAMGLASQAVQIRFSEALTILPVLTTAAVPGVTIGCLLANLTTGCLPWDIVFGTLATLIGAVGTLLMKKTPRLAWIPPVLSNMIIIPFVLMKVYGIADIEQAVPFTDIVVKGSGYWALMISVGVGEIISCGILGLMLWSALKRTKVFDR